MTPRDTADISRLDKWLENGGDDSIEAMRPIQGIHHNALLREYEWQRIDAQVVEVHRTTLVAANDFQRFGLIEPLGGLGVTISTYEQLSDMSDAQLSMEGITRGEKGRQEFTPQSVPVPIIHKDFEISRRMLESARRQGNQIDTTHAVTAARRVRDAIENMIFNGSSVAVAGYKIAGFRTKSQRIQKTASQCGGGDWATPENPYKSIVGAIGFLAAAGFYGPYGVYVARDQYTQSLHLLNGANGSNTNELAVMLQIPQVSFITPADALPAENVIVWQLAKDVADLAIGQDVSTVQWDEMGGMLTQFKVMTALAPRIKSDANGACGVLHMTGA
jgi:uncharacterized linocin/CFP29 family protein